MAFDKRSVLQKDVVAAWENHGIAQQPPEYCQRYFIPCSDVNNVQQLGNVYLACEKHVRFNMISDCTTLLCEWKKYKLLGDYGH